MDDEKAPRPNLSAAEIERLAMLAEECGEVIQVVCKILRHGYESYHPSNPYGPSNRDLLHKELADLNAVEQAMYKDGDLSLRGTERQGSNGDIWRRKLKFTHHQFGSPA